MLHALFFDLMLHMLLLNIAKKFNIICNIYARCGWNFH
jgi:hypothetical protein